MAAAPPRKLTRADTLDPKQFRTHAVVIERAPNAQLGLDIRENNLMEPHIRGVVSGSPASYVEGITPGDVIIGVDGKLCQNIESVKYALSRAGGTVRLTLRCPTDRDINATFTTLAIRLFCLGMGLQACLILAGGDGREKNFNPSLKPREEALVRSAVLMENAFQLALCTLALVAVEDRNHDLRTQKLVLGILVGTFGLLGPALNTWFPPLGCAPLPIELPCLIPPIRTLRV